MGNKPNGLVGEGEGAVKRGGVRACVCACCRAHATGRTLVATRAHTHTRAHLSSGNERRRSARQ